MRRAAGPEAELVRVRVQPRASRNEVVGWREGVLGLRVTAPPAEGEANRAVSALLAGVLGVRPSAVKVVRGARSREKLVRVEGLSAPEVQARLGSEGADVTAPSEASPRGGLRGRSPRSDRRLLSRAPGRRKP